MSSALDELFRLVGDEDCGVGINCRECDRGGLPVAHYEARYLIGGEARNPYEGTDVVFVQSIEGLIDAARRHAAQVHGRPDV